MTIHIVRLGTARLENEGLRIGTVRRPPRGVKKSDYAAQHWFDVWLPQLSPTAELMKQGQAAVTDAQWASFAKRFRKEFATPDNSRLLDLLAALSHTNHFSIGCYCEDPTRCHRTLLGEALAERGASIG